MRAYRIADRRHPIFDGSGAAFVGGRWNSPGRAVIYAAETLELAMLELLAHLQLGVIPRTQVFVEIQIPARVTIETADPAAVPGWDASDEQVSRRFGDRWADERRSAMLRVPSVLTWQTHPTGWNLLINPAHPDAAALKVSNPRAVNWDARLFGRPGGE